MNIDDGGFVDVVRELGLTFRQVNVICGCIMIAISVIDVDIQSNRERDARFMSYWEVVFAFAIGEGMTSEVTEVSDAGLMVCRENFHFMVDDFCLPVNVVSALARLFVCRIAMRALITDDDFSIMIQRFSEFIRDNSHLRDGWHVRNN